MGQAGASGAMGLVVYGDLYFAINLTVDFLLLWMTGAWVGQKVHPWRILAAAILGAAYAFTATLLPLAAWLGWLPLRLLFPLLMLAVAFDLSDWRPAVRLIGVFYGVSLVAGGAALASQFWGSPAGWLQRGVFVLRQYNLMVPVILASLAAGRQVFLFAQRAIGQARRYYPVEVAFGERRVRLRALMDTGNHLRDPLLQLPVMVITYESLAPLLPAAVRPTFEATEMGAAGKAGVPGVTGSQAAAAPPPAVDPEGLAEALEGTHWAERLRLIPFSSLGQQGGLLVCFRPDAVYFWDGERMVVATQALVGVYSRRLDEAGRYNALLSPDFLTSA